MARSKNGSGASRVQLTEKGAEVLSYRQHIHETDTGRLDIPGAMASLRNANMETIVQALYAGLDGWLRAVPSDDGVTYLKWKFTSGAYPNHYVMFRQEDENHRLAFLGLYIKVWSVRNGLKRPTKDKYFE